MKNKCLITCKMYQLQLCLDEHFGSILILLLCGTMILCGSNGEEYVSAVGDPGMKRDGLRLGLESWNQCNEVGEEAPHMGSPRVADCFDLYKASPLKTGRKKCSLCDLMPYVVVHRVTEDDNKLGQGQPFPGEDPKEGFNMTTLQGSFFGSWDLDAPFRSRSIDNDNGNGNRSFYSVSWEKEVGNGSWVLHHVLRTSEKYPWLMLYLRADATQGFSGGYHYPARGVLKIIPESPNFKVTFKLEIIQGGGPSSQFYLMDIGSCWKNNGKPCDGNVISDVTRYNEMILNPSTPSWCDPGRLGFCPPYHTYPNGSKVHRNDTEHFPYEAYHIYCAPGNGEHLEEPVSYCDPFSNPQPQETLQILPHAVWAEYGYPTNKGDGWVGDPKYWELDVGRLSQSLFFYQVHLLVYFPSLINKHLIIDSRKGKL